MIYCAIVVLGITTITALVLYCQSQREMMALLWEIVGAEKKPKAVGKCRIISPYKPKREGGEDV